MKNLKASLKKRLALSAVLAAGLMPTLAKADDYTAVTTAITEANTAVTAAMGSILGIAALFVAVKVGKRILGRI